MRRWSLKTKLTVLYSFFMILLTCVSLAILFSLSNKEILGSVQSRLQDQVYGSVDDFREKNGEIKVDRDFYDLEDGIYLSLYEEEGNFLYGRLPYGFDRQPEFLDGQIQTISGKEEKWYVFDVKCQFPESGVIYVRGVTSVTEAENSMRVTLRFALILLPMMVVLVTFLGYRFTRHTLQPVKRITDTVQEIRASEDLSKRVGLGEGKDEIYRLAQTFDALLAELGEAFAREQQFTSDVAHELRTPIAVILAQCGEMLEYPGISERQREQLHVIEQKARIMAQMISQLLLLTRADQGRQQLQMEKILVSELTEMIVEEQQMLAEEKQITVTGEIERDLYAEVDETLYIRMLVNLISNSINYGKVGGHVWIRLSRQGEELKGSVKDDGIGISAEALPHIWERFYREDASRTGSHSGLGLSMVKWIVQAHHGRIEAKSEPGRGTVFTFCLPISQSSQVPEKKIDKSN